MSGITDEIFTSSVQIADNVSNGQVCASPWGTVDKLLYLDVKAFVASKRYNRNILSSRYTAKSKTTVFTDQTITLPYIKDGAPSTFTYTALPGNSMTIVSANTLVNVVVKTPKGELDLGAQTIFVISSPIMSLVLTNAIELDVEINLITV